MIRGSTGVGPSPPATPVEEFPMSLRILLISAVACAITLVAPATSDAQEDHGRADYGTEGESSEASGYRNVDIYEQGRFRMRDKRDYRNLVIVAPRIIPPGIALRYDRLLSDKISLVLGAGFGSVGTGDVRLQRIEGLLGMNWHPIGNGMHGFFLGPRVRINQYSLIVKDGGGSSSNGSVTTIGGGAVAGWRWIWDPGFSLGLGLGAQYLSAVSSADATNADGTSASTGTFNFDGVFPVIEITLGWGF